MPGCLVVWLLAAWLPGWLAGWLSAGLLTDWLIGCLAGWLAPVYLVASPIYLDADNKSANNN